MRSVAVVWLSLLMGCTVIRSAESPDGRQQSVLHVTLCVLQFGTCDKDQEAEADTIYARSKQPPFPGADK